MRRAWESLSRVSVGGGDSVAESTKVGKDEDEVVHIINAENGAITPSTSNSAPKQTDCVVGVGSQEHTLADINAEDDAGPSEIPVNAEEASGTVGPPGPEGGDELFELMLSGNRGSILDKSWDPMVNSNFSLSSSQDDLSGLYDEDITSFSGDEKNRKRNDNEKDAAGGEGNDAQIANENNIDDDLASGKGGVPDREKSSTQGEGVLSFEGKRTKWSLFGMIRPSTTDVDGSGGVTTCEGDVEDESNCGKSNSNSTLWNSSEDQSLASSMPHLFLQNEQLERMIANVADDDVEVEESAKFRLLSISPDGGDADGDEEKYWEIGTELPSKPGNDDSNIDDGIDEFAFLIEAFRSGEVFEGARRRPNDVALDPRAKARGFGSVSQDRSSRLQDECDEEVDAGSATYTHPNQALFDILDRNFSSLSPQGNPIGDMQSRPLTAEDVRLCFVAFVSIFSPPPKSQLAEDYNHTIDEDLAARELSNDGRVCSEHRPEHDDKSNFRWTGRPSVPMDLAVALWSEVLTGDGRNMNAPFINNRNGDVFATSPGRTSPAISYVVDSMVSIGLVDVMENTEIKSKIGRLQSENGKQRTQETIVVHRDINQEYGEYLADSNYCDRYPQLIEDNEQRWSSALADFGRLAEGGWNVFFSEYDIRVLPKNLIRAQIFDSCSDLLREERFINRRLEVMGVLEGTTAQVTDIDDLILDLCDKWDSYEGNTDWRAFLLEAYNNARVFMTRNLTAIDEVTIASYDDGSHNYVPRSITGETVGRSDIAETSSLDLIKTGRALHLIGVSLGTHGYIEEEIQYYLHSLSLKERVAGGMERIDTSDTLHCLAFACDSVGRTGEAIENYDRALDIRLKLLGENDLRVAETLHNKGALCCERGEIEDALDFLDEALRIRTEHLGDDHENVADTKQWLGNVMREWGDHEEAIEYFKEALRIKKMVLGEDHEDVSNTIYNLAIVLDDLGHFDESISCYEEALRIRRLQYPNDDVNCADYLQCLGNASNSLGDQETALAYFNESIEVRENLLVPDSSKEEMLEEDYDPQFVRLSPYEDDVKAQYEKLSVCYEEALPLMSSVTGDSSTDTAILLRKMGNIYLKTQYWEKCIGSLNGALKARKALGMSGRSEDLITALMFYQKGKAHLRWHEPSLAKSSFELSLKLRILHVGEKSIEVAMSLYGLGFALGSLKKHHQAIIALNECYNILKTNIGEEHLRCGDALHLIGRQLAASSSFEMALTKYTAALRVYKFNNLKVDRRFVAITLHFMGRAYDRLKHSGSAMKCYREEIRMLRWLEEANLEDASDHASLYSAYVLAGDVQARAGEYEESIKYFELALEQAKLAFGREGKQVVTTMEKLGVIFAKKGQNILAKETFTNAYTLREAVSGRQSAATAVTAFKLGCILDKLDEQEAAGVCFAEVVYVQKEKLGLKNEAVAKSLYKMGENYAKRGLAKDAIASFQDALTIRRKVSGDDSEVVALTLHRLANAYMVVNEEDKGILCFKESFRIRQSNRNEHSAEMAELSFDMARCYNQSGDYQQASSHCARAVEAFRQRSRHDARLLQSLYLMGVVYDKRGKFGDAAEVISDAIDILGEEGEDTKARNAKTKLLGFLARIYRQQNDFKKAIDCYQDHMATIPSDFPNREEITAEDLLQLGNIYDQMNLLDIAIEHLQKCLDIRKRTGNIDGSAQALFNIAMVQEKQKDYQSGIRSLRDALRTYKMNGLSSEAALSLSKIGELLEKTGNNPGAMEAYSQALDMIRASPSSVNDVFTANTLHDYGSILMKSGNPGKARPLIEECLAIRTEKLGKNDLKTLESLHCIAELCIKDQQHDQAIEHLEYILTIRRAELLDNHEDVASCLQSLGLAHIERNEGDDLEKALQCLNESMKIKSESGGQESLESASVMQLIGRAYGKQKEFKKARDMFVNALRVRKIELGNDAPECALTLFSLGDIQEKAGKWQEAENCWLESLRIFRLSHGSKSVEVAQTLKSLGVLSMKTGHPETAQKDLKEALVIYQQTSSDTQHEADTLLVLGKAYAQMQQRKEGLESFKASLELRKMVSGKDHVSIAEVVYEIGLLSESQGAHRDAVDCLNECVRIYRLGDQDVQIAMCLNRLAAVHSEDDEHEKALLSCQSALSLYKASLGDDAVEVGHTLHQIGGIQDLLERRDDSLKNFQSALRIFELELDENDSAIALVHSNIGINFARRKDFKKAIEHCASALSIRKNAKGSDDHDIAATAFDLASIYDESENYDKALRHYNQALVLYRSCLGDDDVEVANCLKSIGSILVRREDEEEALHTLLEAVRIYELSGDNCPALDLAIVLLHLGQVYQNRADYEEALSCFAQCLKTRKAEIGEEASDVAPPAFHIGSIYLLQRKLDIALVFLNTARDIYKESFGTESLQYVDTLAKIAEVLILEEDYDVALSELQNCLRLYKKSVGNDDERMAATLSMIGTIHDKRVEYEDAMKYFSGALKIRIKIYGKNHEKVASTMLEIGSVLDDWGDSEESLDCLNEALRIQRLRLGSNNVAVAETLSKLGSVHSERDQHDMALKCYEEGLAAYKLNLGEGAREVGHTLQQIGAAHDSLGQHEESLRVFSQAFKVFKGLGEDEDLSVAMALNSLGINHARRMDYPRAVELCGEAIRIRKARLGDDHLEIADGLYNLANILDEWHRSDQALKFFAEALSIYRKCLGEDDVEVANCLRFMGSIFEKENETDDALASYDQAIRIYQGHEGHGNCALEQAAVLWGLGRIYGKRSEYDRALSCFSDCYAIRKSRLGEDHEDTMAVKRFLDAIERKRRRNAT